MTFDSGGISIKPSAGMHEMKFDMSGGAAVLEAFDTRSPSSGSSSTWWRRSRRPRTCPAGRAVKPGDIITQLNGKTVEVNNTDAEGRLILADALTYCVRELGAERLVDLATLTGAVVVALGSTYAGLISNDDDVGEAVERAASESGELAWRLPLHDEYRELTKGTVADLTNAAAKRKASTIYAARFPGGSSSTTCPGRTWTSPAPPGTLAASTSARARAASACGCWCGLRGIWPADRPKAEPAKGSREFAMGNGASAEALRDRVPTSWAAQQLTEFLAAISAADDERAAIRDAVERATEAFEAEAGAIVGAAGGARARPGSAQPVPIRGDRARLERRDGPPSGARRRRVPGAFDLDRRRASRSRSCSPATSEPVFSSEERNLARGMAQGAGADRAPAARRRGRAQAA